MEKKPILTTNKALLYLVIVSWAVTLILFLSGFKKINPLLFLMAIASVIAYVYYVAKKRKPLDAYDVLEKWKNSYYQKQHSFLDTRDFQIIPITPTSAYIHLPYEGIVALAENNNIQGIEYNHIYRVLRRQEKSNLFKESLKYLGAESRIRQSAEALNVDLRSLGLE